MDSKHTTKNMDGARTCSFCNSEEGKLRPVGQYIVKLSSASIGGRTHYACQTCRVTNKEFLNALKTETAAE